MKRIGNIASISLLDAGNKQNMDRLEGRRRIVGLQ